MGCVYRVVIVVGGGIRCRRDGSSCSITGDRNAKTILHDALLDVPIMIVSRVDNR